MEGTHLSAPLPGTTLHCLTFLMGLGGPDSPAATPALLIPAYTASLPPACLHTWPTFLPSTSLEEGLTSATTGTVLDIWTILCHCLWDSHTDTTCHACLPPLHLRLPLPPQRGPAHHKTNTCHWEAGSWDHCSARRLHHRYLGGLHLLPRRLSALPAPSPACHLLGLQAASCHWGTLPASTCLRTPLGPACLRLLPRTAAGQSPAPHIPPATTTATACCWATREDSPPAGDSNAGPAGRTGLGDSLTHAYHCQTSYTQAAIPLAFLH